MTVATTTTVERTTTQETVPTTTAAESSEDGTPVWVWVTLAILATALAAAIVLLARRGGHQSLSPESAVGGSTTRWVRGRRRGGLSRPRPWIQRCYSGRASG